MEGANKHWEALVINERYDMTGCQRHGASKRKGAEHSIVDLRRPGCSSLRAKQDALLLAPVLAGPSFVGPLLLAPPLLLVPLLFLAPPVLDPRLYSKDWAKYYLTRVVPSRKALDISGFRTLRRS